MNRDRNEHVTNQKGFALLVQAVPPQVSMGVATFFVEIGAPLPVRPVTREELKIVAKKLRGTDGKEFDALLQLRGALEAQDELALAKAKEALQEVSRLRQKEDTSRRSTQNEESRRKFGEVIAPSIGLPPEESYEHYSGLRPGPRAMENPGWLLSQVVSRIVDMWASVVLWWVEGRFIPAIYCIGPDHDFAMRVALYIHTFFIAPSGQIGIRACPYCSDQFWQDQSNQDFCCINHRESHRVARFRYRKKLQAAKK